MTYSNSLENYFSQRAEERLAQLGQRSGQRGAVNEHHRAPDPEPPSPEVVGRDEAAAELCRRLEQRDRGLQA